MMMMTKAKNWTELERYQLLTLKHTSDYFRISGQSTYPGVRNLQDGIKLNLVMKACFTQSTSISDPNIAAQISPCNNTAARV